MFGISPLVPAYGRDYRSKAAVQADLDADKDFRTADGRLINRPQLRELGLREVNVRYGKLRKVAVCTVREESI